MCNLFLADEINRTSAKTQSALLEVMEEGKVTIDGITRKVSKPFIVIATQNPVGSIGTQMLPESQLDRFMIKLTMGYPDMESEIEILKGKQKKVPLDEINTVVTKEDILVMQDLVENIYIHEKIYEYIVTLISKTRNHPLIDLGVSPRGSVALTKLAKAIVSLIGINGSVLSTPHNSIEYSFMLSSITQLKYQAFLQQYQQACLRMGL